MYYLKEAYMNYLCKRRGELSERMDFLCERENSDW